MTGSIILIITLCLPLALGVLWRVAAPHIFFSIMAGELLARYFGPPIEKFIHHTKGSETVASYAEPIIMTIPILLTGYFLRDSLIKGKTLLHIPPLIIIGVIYATFALPMLPTAVQSEIKDIQYANQLLHMNSFIIGAVVISQLISLWLLNRHTESKHKK